jgi:hypothetical protein
VTTRNPRVISCFPASQFAHRKVRPVPIWNCPNANHGAQPQLGWVSLNPALSKNRLVQTGAVRGQVSHLSVLPDWQPSDREF